VISPGNLSPDDEPLEFDLDPPSPGSRSGEGAESIIPHLQKQQLVQIKVPTPDDKPSPHDS